MTKPNHPFIVRGRYGKAFSNEVNQLLGLGPKQKLPVAGLPPRDIQGIQIYVAALPDPHPVSKRRRFALRVMAICPGCNRHLAVGRLHQHVCKPTAGKLIIAGLPVED